jgi:hypothetical protein
MNLDAFSVPKIAASVSEPLVPMERCIVATLIIFASEEAGRPPYGYFPPGR